MEIVGHQVVQPHSNPGSISQSNKPGIYLNTIAKVRRQYGHSSILCRMKEIEAYVFQVSLPCPVCDSNQKSKRFSVDHAWHDGGSILNVNAEPFALLIA